jgi:hypothetical protein
VALLLAASSSVVHSPNVLPKDVKAVSQQQSFYIRLPKNVFCLLCFCFFQTESHQVPRLASDSQCSRLSLLSAGITGVLPPTQQKLKCAF